jgi:hypothetical protein
MIQIGVVFPFFVITSQVPNRLCAILWKTLCALQLLLLPPLFWACLRESAKTYFPDMKIGDCDKTLTLCRRHIKWLSNLSQRKCFFHHSRSYGDNNVAEVRTLITLGGRGGSSKRGTKRRGCFDNLTYLQSRIFRALCERIRFCLLL